MVQAANIPLRQSSMLRSHSSRCDHFQSECGECDRRGQRPGHSPNAERLRVGWQLSARREEDRAELSAPLPPVLQRLQIGEDAHQRRLARPVGADEGGTISPERTAQSTRSSAFVSPKRTVALVASMRITSSRRRRSMRESSGRRARSAVSQLTPSLSSGWIGSRRTALRIFPDHRRPPRREPGDHVLGRRHAA